LGRLGTPVISRVLSLAAPFIAAFWNTSCLQGQTWRWGGISMDDLRQAFEKTLGIPFAFLARPSLGAGKPTLVFMPVIGDARPGLRCGQSGGAVS
jgi:hypothetical protein